MQSYDLSYQLENVLRIQPHIITCIILNSCLSFIWIEKLQFYLFLYYCAFKLFINFHNITKCCDRNIMKNRLFSFLKL